MLAVLLYLGAKLVISGDLTVGELVAFNMLAGRVSAPVLRLAQIWQDFHQARLSVARLGDILNTPAESTYMPGRTVLPSIRGQLAVTVEIKTGTRQIISYLLSPLLRYKQESLRER